MDHHHPAVALSSIETTTDDDGGDGGGNGDTGGALWEEEPKNDKDLRTMLRLRLNAANLPRQGLFGLPDTFATVTSVTTGGPDVATVSPSHHRTGGGGEILSSSFNSSFNGGSDSGGNNSINGGGSINDGSTMNGNSITSLSSGKSGFYWGETEVVYKSKSPQWTTTLRIAYEYGTTVYFYVHVLLYDATLAASSKRDQMKTLGTAVFEVGDILGTRNNTKVKRLRSGGCVFCRLEPILSADNLARRFHFQLAARDLILPHAKLRNVTVQHLLPNNSVHQPDTIFEIARNPDYHRTGGWVSVYRSPPVKNSVRPVWDRVDIDISSLCRGDFDRHLRISVYEVKPNGSTSALIGMCETTLGHVLEAASTPRDQDADNNGDDACCYVVHELFLQRNSSKVKEVGRLQFRQAELLSPGQPGIQVADVRGSATTTRTTTTTTPSGHAEEDDGVVLEVVDLASLQPMSAPSPSAGSTTSSLSFQDYIRRRGGCQMDLCVAIDFTSSNGDPRYEDSLHYQGGGDSMNDYEETISAIGRALINYNNNHRGGTTAGDAADAGCCTVWGFGAKFGGEARHLFQCGQERTVSGGVEGILAAYKSMFATGLIMSGPTVFTQVIQAAAMRAKRHHDEQRETPRLHYTLLLIITDGIMSNFEETQRKIAVYAQLPLSIVFVGVGRSDFGSMYRLCNNNNNNNNNPSAATATAAAATTGTTAARQTTTFVEFRRLQDDPSALGRAALQNVPRQLCEYMKINST